jgi:hypothetical protein
MIHLTNAAVINIAGTYTVAKVDKDVFTIYLKNKTVKSWLGYQQNADILFDMTGIRFEIDRGTLNIQPGDEILVMKLKFRLDDTSKKSNQNFQKTLTPDDFDFLIIKYN